MERTSSLLCPLALEDMSYSRATTVADDDGKDSDTDKDGQPKELLAVSIVLAVSALLACGFAGMMYAKEKAGQPMFMKIEDQEPDSKA